MSENSSSPATAVAAVEPTIERIERFQSLQAGQFWRAKEAIHEMAIEERDVHLLQSIRWVDNSPHTIIIRAHPSKYDTQVRVEIPNAEGNITSRYITCKEHPFLLADFLAKFEFEPDHQQVRADEIKRIQGRVTELQNDLMEAQADPQILNGIVEERMAADRAKETSSESASEQTMLISASEERSLAGVATGSVAAAIGSGITPEKIKALKSVAAREHKVATIKSDWIQAKTTEIAATVKAMTPYFQETAAAALAQTEDVRTYVASLIEGIESLDLFTGKDVAVQTISTGRSADSHIPLSIVQRKLMMDEELAIYVDLDEWFDFSNEDLFFKALTEHEELVNQVFPTERCILVMATSRRAIDYGNAATNLSRNLENRKVFLLVRDGENLHRVWSPIESHLGTSRLFPSKDDQNNIFKGVDGSDIKFQDVAYTSHLKAHENFALHYKRFLLMICGLDHRLGLFGKFYDGEQSLEFMTQPFQDRWLKFIHDDDGAGMLPTQKRKPLHTWISEKNAYLKSGSRVLCNWHTVMNPHTAPGACRKEDHRHSGFSFRFQPTERIGLRIAARGGDSLHVFVNVQGYGRRKEREFSTKVTLSAFRPGYWSHAELPFLVLDAVTPEELHWYIHDRDSREDHVEYVRFFKHALKHLEAERAREAATRDKMRMALLDGGLATATEASIIVDQAVVAWRSVNRGKELPSFEGAKLGPVWKTLLDQMYLLAGAGQEMASTVRSHYEALEYEVLRITVTGTSKCHVYLSPKPEEQDNRLERHAWVHRIVLEQDHEKLIERDRSWEALRSQDASETELYQSDSVKNWLAKSVFESFEAKQRLMTVCEDYSSVLAMLQGKQAISADQHWDLFEQWIDVREKLSTSQVVDPSISVPFGLKYQRDQNVSFFCVTTSAAYALLHRLAPNEHVKDRMKAKFLSTYKHAHQALSCYRDAINEDPSWYLGYRDVTPKRNESILTGRLYKGDFSPSISVNNLLTYHFSSWAEGDGKESKYWIAGNAVFPGARESLDDCLGLSLPENFDPVNLVEVTAEDNGKPVKNGHWFDVAPVKISLQMRDASPIKASQFSYKRMQFASPAEAHEHIRARARTLGRKAIPEAEVKDVLPSPDGVERWFTVDGKN
ncbi:hypothetical protein [Pseudomonas hormoni]|jgi:hypothetical protein